MYLFDNELFAIECVAKYAMEGLDVKQGGVHDGYPDEFAHCPYPMPKGQTWRLAGDLGYWLTFYDHQHQGLLQSVDEGRMCYWNADVKKYLDTWPPGCFELWDIYDKFNKLTEETKRKISKALRGKYNSEKAPWYGKTGAAHNSSKAIIAIEPDGTKLYFGSVREAARELKMSNSNLSTYANSGHVLTQGPRKGYQFFYAVKE